MIFNFTIEELPEVAKLLVNQVSNKVLLFYGEMGVGKTTLIKELVKQLEVGDTVSSPTFSLVNEYHSVKGEKVFHFDFYRIEHEDEALDIGIEDYLYNNDWCFIEWPEKVKNLLPLNAVEIHLSLNDNGTRSLEIKQ